MLANTAAHEAQNSQYFLTYLLTSVRISRYLHGVVEDLVFILLDVDDVLKHVIQLVLAQNRLGRSRLPLLGPLPRVVVATADLVEL